jgi:hypothetical protein
MTRNRRPPLPRQCPKCKKRVSQHYFVRHICRDCSEKLDYYDMVGRVSDGSLANGYRKNNLVAGHIWDYLKGLES